MRLRPLLGPALLLALFGAPSAHATEPIHHLSLEEATAHALARHPAGTTAEMEELAALARVDVAKSEAVPRLSIVGQLNRSTGDVVPGATFSISGIPGIQGPPGATRLGAGTWQTVAGVTASWDVLEVVRRPTIVDAAGADATATKARTLVSRLAIVAEAADDYLLVAEARALVNAARANEARTKTLYDVVATLTEQKLRPDLDLARAETELAAARTLVDKTRLGEQVTSARLAEAIGETDWSVAIDDSSFVDLPTAPSAPSSPHPEVVAYESSARAARARGAVQRLGYLPKAELVGAAWLRGGGYVLGGPNSGDAGGVLPDTPNWALGVVATWTPTDIGVASAKNHSEQADAAVQHAKGEEAEAALSANEKVARATFQSSLAVATETKVAVSAAKRALDLANARYTTGNGTVLEVADAERVLAAAERDDAIARLEAWRAVVAIYRAQGDLRPLLGFDWRRKG